MHLGGLLADDKLTVVGRGQLVQAEEAQIGKNLVECAVVTVRASRVTLEENTGENLNMYKNKWLVTFIKRPKIDHQTSWNFLFILENLLEYLNSTYSEEFLISSAAIKHLLDKDLLIGIRELSKQNRGLAKSILQITATYLWYEFIGVRVDRLNHGIKSFDASNAVLY